MNVDHKFATVNGIKLHYVTAGNGPLVILLHGFPEFWYGWKNQIPALSEKFKVVAVDMRGYNESDKPKGVKNYLPETVAQDIKELIFSLNEKKAHIVGHDWGGAIAWTLAQQFPECVDRLVVLNCPIPQLMGKNLRKNFRQMRKSWYMLYFQLPFLPEWGIRRNLRLFFTKALRGWSRNEKAFSNEDIMEYVKAFQRPDALTGAINYYRAGLANVFKPGANKVNQIGADTLLIWGENDKALGKELTYGMEKYFTGKFEIQYISDCSHWVQHDHPDKVNELIINFLGS